MRKVFGGGGGHTGALLLQSTNLLLMHLSDRSYRLSFQFAAAAVTDERQDVIRKSVSYIFKSGSAEDQLRRKDGAEQFSGILYPSKIHTDV